ncbi:ceramide synthase 4-like isoform X2 [Hemicordylus capensis]|uniref:ceramide synthase 4-like isoform X2 n=1 Tax=Hemicordylus capensis TaxID=884348 RepID=UPI0023033AC6|nr:ceramide synthase 4-like isoform X2 [Hemicordylus capensis]
MTLPLTAWLWRHEYWLPPGITWEDMKETEETRYPQPKHLLVSLPCALLLIGLRFIFERFVAVPLSQKMGLKERLLRKASPNPVLEAFYAAHHRSPKEGELSGLAKQCDLQPRQVERWFRCRRNQDRPSLTKKFCEASWRTTFYLTSFCTGLATLYDPLLYSTFGYYMLELSFYCSLVITLPFDVKRKDFYEQIVHHAITISLISFSYCANYIRIGTLVMIIHDASDCFLEPTKIFNYLKWRKICDLLFIIFSAIFLFTRLVVFPYKVLYNTYYYSMEIYQPFLGYYLMNGLLMVLQLLHIFWSCMIIHMVYRFLLRGTMERDLRSDSEDSENNEEETLQEKEAKRNGVLPPSPNSNGSCLGIGKETPLQLNGRSRPTDSHAKMR